MSLAFNPGHVCLIMHLIGSRSCRPVFYVFALDHRIYKMITFFSVAFQGFLSFILVVEHELAVKLSMYLH